MFKMNLDVFAVVSMCWHVPTSVGKLRMGLLLGKLSCRNLAKKDV
jgi:hypothetical protein